VERRPDPQGQGKIVLIYEEDIGENNAYIEWKGICMAKRKLFGEILVEAGVITETALRNALHRQSLTGGRLGQVLEQMTLISEHDIAVCLGRQFGFKMVRDFAKYSFSAELLQLVGAEEATKNFIFPLKKEEKVLYLAMSNPLDIQTIDNITFRTRLRIVPCVTTPKDVLAAVNRHYLKQETEKAQSDWWTVLVVDDQETLRTAMVAALKKQGYAVLEGVNGAEGLKMALQQHPHLIVTDTMMTRMDGVEMFRALQANSSTHKLPVIALSSKASAEEEARLLGMGYFDFIAKPANPVRLVARVKRALQMVYGDSGPPMR
jgi:CheY-like chemotaxis protein